MKELIKNIALFISASFVVLFSAEGAANIFDVTPRPLNGLDLRSYRLSTNQKLRYEFIPNYSPEQKPFDPDHNGFKTNSLGFRDVEHSLEKPTKTKRIIFLGDSTTAGNGVSDFAKIYTSQVQKALNQEPSDTKYEIFNMGTGGYQTMQEVEALKEKGLQFKPDIVVLLFCLNDFGLNSDGGVYTRLKEMYQGIDVGVTQSIVNRSRLAFSLYHRLGLGQKRNLDDKWYEQNILNNQNPANAGLKFLAELQKEHGFKAVILILPEFKNTIDRYQRHYDHSRLKEIANSEGLPIVDLVDKFAERDQNLAHFSYDSCHMNETGHNTITEIITPIVRQMLTEDGVKT